MDAHRSRLEAAARMHDGVKDRMRRPRRAISSRLPLDVDGGRRWVDAFRVQHDDTLGPFKGGIRFHPSVTRGEVERLALGMTLKTALHRLPFGGGKGGVAVDPDILEALSHLDDNLNDCSQDTT